MLQEKWINTIIVARNVYPVCFNEDQLGLKIFLGLSRYFNRLFLIVQSPDNRPHNWERGNLSVHYVPQCGSYLWNTAYFVISATKTAIKIKRAFGVNVSNGSDLLGGIVSLLMKWFCGTKFVMQFQYQFFSLPPVVPAWRRIVFKKVAVFLGRRADNIRCVTREIREMARLEGVPEWALRVIPARCDVEMFRPNREIRKQTRLSLSIQNKKVIIYLGSLLVLKGVYVLLEAIKNLSVGMPDLAVILAGDGVERRELERKVRDYRLEGKVLFLGQVPYSEVPKILCSGDVFVFPSFSEAMPRAVLEAMAM